MPVVAVVEHDVAVARAVDAGLLGARLPNSLGARCGERHDRRGPTSSVRCGPGCATKSTDASGDPHRVRALARAAAPCSRKAPRSAETVDRVARVASIGLGPLEPLARRSDRHRGDGQRRWFGVDRTARRACNASRSSCGEDDVLQLIERVVAPLGRHVDRLQPDRRRAAARRFAGPRRRPAARRRRAQSHDPAIRRPPDPARRALRRLGRRAAALGGRSAGEHSGVRRCVGRARPPCSTRSAAEIPPSERVVTVEDAAELRLPGEHVVRLESRPANAEGIGEVRVRDLVRSALRMRPDRIVVGEIRGGEALDMLQAMNTGHDGSLSTCHANSSGRRPAAGRDAGAHGRCRPPARRGARAGCLRHRRRRPSRPPRRRPRRVVAVAEVEPGSKPDGRRCGCVRLAHGAKVIALPATSRAVGGGRARLATNGSTGEPGADARSHRHERPERRRGLRSTFAECVGTHRARRRLTASGAIHRSDRSVDPNGDGACPVAPSGRSGRPRAARRGSTPARDRLVRARRCGSRFATVRWRCRRHPSVAVPRAVRRCPRSRRVDRGSRWRVSTDGPPGSARAIVHRASAWRSRSADRRPGCSMPPRRRCTSGPRWRVRCGRCRPRPGRPPWS